MTTPELSPEEKTAQRRDHATSKTSSSAAPQLMPGAAWSAELCEPLLELLKILAAGYIPVLSVSQPCTSTGNRATGCPIDLQPPAQSAMELGAQLHIELYCVAMASPLGQNSDHPEFGMDKNERCVDLRSMHSRSSPKTSVVLRGARTKFQAGQIPMLRLTRLSNYLTLETRPV